MLLESQYIQWLLNNPAQPITYEDWLTKWGEEKAPFISDNFQIGPNGA